MICEVPFRKVLTVLTRAATGSCSPPDRPICPPSLQLHRQFNVSFETVLHHASDQTDPIFLSRANPMFSVPSLSACENARRSA